MAKRKRKPVKRVPLGKAIRWTEQEIDDFLTVTPEDIELVRNLWRKYARNTNLIDAKLQDDSLDAITGTANQ